MMMTKRMSWALVLAMTMAAGGCGDSAAGIEGDWELVSFEAGGVSTTCPGFVEVTSTLQINCTSEALSFRGDDSFVRVQTTDELGDPFDWREEGNWSTEGSELTMTTEREGTDADNLQQVDPPDTFVFEWSVSESTLTRSFPLGEEVLAATYERM